VRSGSPRLGRFDSCAAPLEGTLHTRQFVRIARACVECYLQWLFRRLPRLQAFRTIAQTIAHSLIQGLNSA
jgi:hypothetical protein